MMVGFRPSYFFMFCWRFVGPVAMVVIFCASIVEIIAKGTWYEAWDPKQVNFDMIHNFIFEITLKFKFV